MPQYSSTQRRPPCLSKNKIGRPVARAAETLNG
jgi:hypothetical protein